MLRPNPKSWAVNELTMTINTIQNPKYMKKKLVRVFVGQFAKRPIYDDGPKDARQMTQTCIRDKNIMSLKK